MRWRRPGVLFVAPLCGVLCLSLLAAPAAGGPVSSETAAPASQEGRFFPETGFRIADDRFFTYFGSRGGLTTFGFPASRRFLLFGTRVQFFQRHAMQLRADGSVGLLNLLDEGLLPFTEFGDASIPAFDASVALAAPAPDTPSYGDAVRVFLSAQVPDEWQGLEVGFLSAFLRPGQADGESDAVAQTLVALEILGFPTSHPAADPTNPGFVYQRFQRGALHFDAATGETQPLLLADYLKAVIMGRDLSAALQAQASSSRLYLQYAPGRPLWLARPDQLPDTDLTAAFERDDLPLVVPAPAPPAAALPGPGGGVSSPPPLSMSVSPPPPPPPPTATPTSPVPAATPTPVATATFTPNPVEPRVDGLEPWSLAVGQDLMIRGKGFGPQPGHVLFTGKLTTGLVWGDTNIIVTVPQGASDGTVRVRRPDGVFSNAVPFTIATAPTATPVQPGATATPTDPLISELRPAGGTPNSQLIVLGINFGPTVGQVFVGDFQATVSQANGWSDTSIVVTVPGQLTGPAAVRVFVRRGTDGRLSPHRCHTVFQPTPTTAPGTAMPTPAGTPTSTPTPSTSC